MSDQATTTAPDRIALIGFGEAANAFLSGWREEGVTAAFSSYDIKLDSSNLALREAVAEDFTDTKVEMAADSRQAAIGAAAIFSVVTTDQAVNAAAETAQGVEPGAFYFDCNSVSPATKRQAANVIEGKGGRYVDTAVMAPVRATRHKTPLLLSGPYAEEAAEVLKGMGMVVDVMDGEVGHAASVKMIRSVMMKGLESLMLECVLAGRKAGVEDIVLETLERSYPGFDWPAKAVYMLERVMTHGQRRAAEMREASRTIDELGLGGWMSSATASRQQQVGDLNLSARNIGLDDYHKLADAILAALGK